MTCIIEHYLDFISEIHNLSVWHRLEVVKTCLDVFCGVERYFGIWAFSALLFVAIAFMLGVLFLNLGGVQQNNFRELGGGLGAIYPAGESIANQLRQ
jgi:hypothetical protein